MDPQGLDDYGDGRGSGVSYLPYILFALVLIILLSRG